MEGRSSLGKVVIKYSFLELLYSLLLVVFFLVVIDLLAILGVFYRADYAQSQLSEVKEELAKETFQVEELPYFYEYQFVEAGQTEQSIPAKYDGYIEEARQKGRSQTNSFIGTRYFDYEKNPYREVVLSYQVTLIFTNERLYRMIPNAELMCSILLFVVWIAGFLGLVRRCIKKIRAELAKVTRTNEAIGKMNLDYQRESSTYKEIQDLLDSLDVMSQELKLSLQEQWATQQEQQELVQSVTHDIRTPITLIKGHLELLEEELAEQQYPSLPLLNKGVQRLEQYIEQLKKMSVPPHLQKTAVNMPIIKEWIQLAEELTQNAKHSLIIKGQDPSLVQLDQQQIARALQNILVNSLEHSDAGTKILLSFDDEPSCYRITVEDEGIGFSQKALDQGTERFYTTNTDQEHHGLGLAIVKEIAAKHQGKVILQNGQVGAKVSLLFEKN